MYGGSLVVEDQAPCSVSLQQHGFGSGPWNGMLDYSKSYLGQDSQASGTTEGPVGSVSDMEVEGYERSTSPDRDEQERVVC